MDLVSPKMFEDVKLTKKDFIDLAPKLKSWVVLSRCYSDMTEEELVKSIIFELNYKRRITLVDRLVSRWVTMQRTKLILEIQELITSEDTGFVDNYLKDIFEELS